MARTYGTRRELSLAGARRHEWAIVAHGERTRFLTGHPTLVVDTRNFNAGFTARLLEAVGDIDAQTDGVLFHSENFQGLSLMQSRYREQTSCAFNDPPYNTGVDGFPYEDAYEHAS